MLRSDQNDRLTRVGPGTPMGDLLRRYWMPVATGHDLAENPVRRVRILGEDLVVFRAEDGGLGLVGERCPHRGASLGYGFPDGDGLRCPYHGWKFSTGGECLDQPNQIPPSDSLKRRSGVPAYPIEEMGGLLWAYLGPGDPPALPRYDLFTWAEGPTRFRDIGYAVIPCNWLQIMENSFDPTHVEWLHGRLFNYHLERAGEPPTVLGGHHVKIAFDLVEYGIIKRRLREGQSEDSEDWRTGHPAVFPNILKVGGSGLSQFQIRVPVDDENTLHFWYSTFEVPDPYAEVAEGIHDLPDSYRVRLTEPDGSFLMDTIDAQDAMAWVTQGARTDREDEHLSSSDQGIALYRNLLRTQLAAAESGEPLMNVLDAATAPEVVELPQENKALGVGGGDRNPFAEFLRLQSRDGRRIPEMARRVDAALRQREGAPVSTRETPVSATPIPARPAETA